MPSTSTSTCRESVPRRKTPVLFPAPPSRDTLRPAYSSSNPARSRAALRSISSRVTTVTDWIASSAVCAVRVAVTVTTGATCSCAQTGRADEQATATPCAKADKRIFIVRTPFAMPRVPARHGNLTWTHREPSRAEESREQTAPVAATPRHIRQFAFRPVSGLVRCAGLGLDGWVAFPGCDPSGCMTHLARTYRCGGSTGIAASFARGRAPVSRLTLGEKRPRAPITRYPFRGSGGG